MVVLPEPLGPSRAKNSPRSMLRSMRSTAVTDPNRLVTDCNVSTAGGTVSPIVDERKGTAAPPAKDRRRRLRRQRQEASTSDQILSHFSGEDG